MSTRQIPVGTSNTVPAKVLDITRGRVLFTGTLKECRSYKRKHFNAWATIYLVGTC